MKPVVSIGFAVRNSLSHYGHAVFREVAESVLRQTYANLEILISDNASTDGTSEACAELARLDSRIRVVRHERPLTAQANFIYVFQNTKGPYFTWMADDDFRTPNLIQVLVEALERRPEACLAFSDQMEFTDHAAFREKAWQVARPFVTVELSTKQRILQMPRGSCTHLCYGLIRRQILERHRWQELENSSFDVPMGYYLSLRAEMIHVPGAVYYRYVPPVAKTVAARARVNNFRLPKPFFPERLAWACCVAAADALTETGCPTAPWRLFPLIYRSQQQGWKGILIRMAPTFIYRTWKVLKARLRESSSARKLANRRTFE